MIRWRRAAAWLGVVAQLVCVHSLGAQSSPSISLSFSFVQGNSIPPAPNMLVNGLNPEPGRTYAITLELSLEPAFARPFIVQSASGLSGSFHLDSLLAPGATIYFRARLIDSLSGVTVAEVHPSYRVLPWLQLDSPPQHAPSASTQASGDATFSILTTRRPLFAWSSPPITLLWQYDLTIVNKRTQRPEQIHLGLTDTSFVADSLQANTSYFWYVTARASKPAPATAVTDTSAGTFAIQSPSQPTVTLFYQNFPNPFGRGQLQEQTCFWFDLAQSATVRLTVFDIRLRQVRQIVPGPIGNGVMNAGSFGRSSVDAKSGCDPALTWDGKDDRGQFVPPGIYIAQFVANGKSTTIKMMYKGPP
jgi:hypothetical protein